MITHSAILAALAELRTTAEAATNETGRWRWGHGVGDMCNDPECPYGALVDEAEPGANYVGTVLMQVHGYDVHESWQGAAHIAAWSPAAALRWLSWAEQVAARHAPKLCECGNPAHFVCTKRPSEESPCEEYAGLIVALGLEET